MLSEIKLAPTCSAICACALLASATTGCRSLGPRTVANDRVAFSEATSDSWKRQMLLNILKIRYADTPTFMEVGQIVAGYTLQGSIAVGGTLSHPVADSLNVGGAASFTDRPTITYTPMTGDRYIQSMSSQNPYILSFKKSAYSNSSRRSARTRANPNQRGQK
jgi:hypothetical protein